MDVYSLVSDPSQMCNASIVTEIVAFANVSGKWALWIQGRLCNLTTALNIQNCTSLRCIVENLANSNNLTRSAYDYVAGLIAGPQRFSLPSLPANVTDIESFGLHALAYLTDPRKACNASLVSELTAYVNISGRQAQFLQERVCNVSIVIRNLTDPFMSKVS